MATSGQKYKTIPSEVSEAVHLRLLVAVSATIETLKICTVCYCAPQSLEDIDWIVSSNNGDFQSCLSYCLIETNTSAPRQLPYKAQQKVSGCITKV
jgi:hypothetical protein